MKLKITAGIIGLALMVAGLALYAGNLQPIPKYPDGPSLVVNDLNHGVTPTDMVNALVGSGLTISNVTYQGDPRAAGLFSGGTTSVGFDSGIILNSGKAQTIPADPPCARGVEGPNNCHEN